MSMKMQNWWHIYLKPILKLGTDFKKIHPRFLNAKDCFVLELNIGMEKKPITKNVPKICATTDYVKLKQITRHLTSVFKRILECILF